MQNTKIINGFPFTKYSKKTFPSNESIRKGTDFYRWMDERRSVRDFSYKPFAKEVIERILLTASTAPSGAHKQPWTSCMVSNIEIKTNTHSRRKRRVRKPYTMQA